MYYSASTSKPTGNDISFFWPGPAARELTVNYYTVFSLCRVEASIRSRGAGVASIKHLFPPDPTSTGRKSKLRNVETRAKVT